MRKQYILSLIGFILFIFFIPSIYSYNCYDNASRSTDINDYLIYDLMDDGVMNTDYWTVTNDGGTPVEANGFLNISGDANFAGVGTNVKGLAGGTLPTSDITIEVSIIRGGADYSQNYAGLAFAGSICSSSTNASNCAFGGDRGILKGGYYNPAYTSDLLENEWLADNGISPYAYKLVSGGFALNTVYNYTVYIENATRIQYYYDNGTLIAIRDTSANATPMDERSFRGFFAEFAYSTSRWVAWGHVLVYSGQECPQPTIPTTLQVTLDSPFNNTANNSIFQSFCYTPLFNYTAGNCYLYTNYTGSWEANLTNTTPQNYTQNCFNMRLYEESTYIWNIYCTTDDGNGAFADNNYTFFLDKTIPLLTVTYPKVAYYTNSVTYQAECLDNYGSVNKFNLTLYNSTGDLEFNITNSTAPNEYTLKGVIDTTYYEVGKYNYTYTCEDMAGNLKTNNSYFYVDNYRPQLSGLSNIGNNLIAGASVQLNVTITDDYPSSYILVWNYSGSYNYTFNVSNSTYQNASVFGDSWHPTYKLSNAFDNDASTFATAPYSLTYYPYVYYIDETYTKIPVYITEINLTTIVRGGTFGGAPACPLIVYIWNGKQFISSYSTDTTGLIITNTSTIHTYPENLSNDGTYYNFTIRFRGYNYYAKCDSGVYDSNISYSGYNSTLVSYTSGIANINTYQPNVSGYYCYQVYALDMALNYNTTQYCFSVSPIYLTNVTYGNYTGINGINYTRILNYSFSYSCSMGTTLNVTRIINSTTDSIMSLPCDYTIKTVNGYYRHDNEDNYTISFVFNSTFGVQYMDTKTFLSDLNNPTIISLNISLYEGFVSPNVNITVICNDSIFTPLFINLTFNGNLLYYDNATRLLNITNISTLAYGTNTLSAVCGDLFGNTSLTKYIQGYPVNLFLINEKTREYFNCSNATKCGYYYNNNSYYDMLADENLTASPINFTSLTSNKLRVEITYITGTTINYYIDVSLINNSQIRICADTSDATFYEQIMYSSLSKKALLKNIYAECYVGADYTRFGYGNSVMLRAFTIPAEYVLYTYQDDNLISLSGIDGGKEQPLNLDTLEFNLKGYDFSIQGEALAFQSNGTERIKIYYNNLANDNIAVSLEIVNLDDNSIVYTEDTFTNPNQFTTFYDFSGLAYTNATVWRATVTSVKVDGTEKTLKKYFNIFGSSGIFSNVMAVIMVVALLFFGLTFFVVNVSFSWIGLILNIISLIILTLAVGAWYITFLEVVVVIFLLFTVLTMISKYYPSVS